MSRLRHPLVGFLILLAVFAYWAYAQSVNVYDAQVSSCQRGNINRQGQLQLATDLVVINHRRVKAASSYAEAEANRFALRRYRRDRNTLIESQASVAKRPGGVTVDCETVYPKPSLWP